MIPSDSICYNFDRKISMNFKNFNEEAWEKIKVFTLSGILIVLFYVLMNNLYIIGNIFSLILKACAPFLYGILFTFIVLPLRKLAERRLHKSTSLSDKNIRKISVAVSMLGFLLVLTGFFVILVPQLVDSIRIFVDSLGGYVRTIQSLIERLADYDPGVADYLENLVSAAGKSLSDWLTGAQGGMSRILNYSINVARGILNFFIGMIIAIYLLYDEEKFKKQIKMIMFGYLNEKTASDILHLMRITKTTFTRFIFGKFIDSLVIGAICWLCCVLLRIPYSLLIAVVIGVTNMIPVFGPFIGAIPCIFILLIIDPFKSLEFAIFILILQQIDGNIIGPYILGDAVGLPTLWVMFAIIAGGALFGIGGMFVGVPVFSVLYDLTKERVQNNLAERKIDIDTK